MLDPPGADRLADLVLAAHAAFVLFVAGGQLLILLGWWRRWEWTRRPLLRWLHLAVVAVVVVEAWVGWVCPLTLLEDALRRGQGGRVYGETGFVVYWLQWLVFWRAPPWVFTAAYTLFALLVAVCFRGYPPRPRPGTRPPGTAAQ